MQPRTVTVNTAARLLGVAANSYRAAARRGEVPAIYIGRRLVVPRSALEILLGEKLDAVAGGAGSAAPGLRSANMDALEEAQECRR